MTEHFTFDREYWESMHEDLRKILEENPNVELTING